MQPLPSVQPQAEGAAASCFALLNPDTGKSTDGFPAGYRFKKKSFQGNPALIE